VVDRVDVEREHRDLQVIPARVVGVRVGHEIGGGHLELEEHEIEPLVARESSSSYDDIGLSGRSSIATRLHSERKNRSLPEMESLVVITSPLPSKSARWAR